MKCSDLLALSHSESRKTNVWAPHIPKAIGAPSTGAQNHKHPQGGIVGPFKNVLYIDSTAPATGNRLPLGFVEGMLFFAFRSFGPASRACGLARLMREVVVD